MKKIALSLLALFVTTLSFAGVSNQGIPVHKALGGAWKANQTTNLQPGHDINIVYGGEDVAQRPALISPTATA